ncbi:PRC-barrel domain containing protein [Sphingobium sp.]|uniref:PRC-barrel domain containing protein n=1 Tax=Sphingobium sp. TaxID=1912891 RepID=UPI002D087740|nr:PRC-barrel domain containing protein [Sphingobium sp.]HUD95808.1 PRC-barrel domain containing protein [Sphingobium sp.]
MTEFAEWVAPIATMIAAIMTASNLGARVTGWGFVVFTMGSIAWTLVGMSSGQTNLMAANCFLTVVNLIGARRWLGRQQAYEEGGRSAQRASRHSSAPSLFPANAILGMSIEDCHGKRIGKAVEAMLECRTGTVRHVVIASAADMGWDEHLRAVAASAIVFGGDKARLRISASEFAQIVPLDGDDWSEIGYLR